ncbi:hypothetical protein PGT21_015444 [Puccinia graminis f. sp. tritici]|uniref:Uncharacterized protein n=1 Tax=Puccinia graminis f. sp. tritici TaxID=56615 RepID=A0A5B0LVW2_PUCGR|nr:hypothetical protein PGT21_015444 [Puccinia graminis f. sp. tritici]
MLKYCPNFVGTLLIFNRLQVFSNQTPMIAESSTKAAAIVRPKYWFPLPQRSDYMNDEIYDLSDWEAGTSLSHMPSHGETSEAKVKLEPGSFRGNDRRILYYHQLQNSDGTADHVNYLIQKACQYFWEKPEARREEVRTWLEMFAYHSKRHRRHLFMPTQASLLYGLQNLRKVYAEDPMPVPHIDSVLKLIKRRIGITENGPAGEVSFNWPWIQERINPSMGLTDAMKSYREFQEMIKGEEKIISVLHFTRKKKENIYHNFLKRLSKARREKKRSEFTQAVRNVIQEFELSTSQSRLATLSLFYHTLTQHKTSRLRREAWSIFQEFEHTHGPGFLYHESQLVEYIKRETEVVKTPDHQGTEPSPSQTHFTDSDTTEEPAEDSL